MNKKKDLTLNFKKKEKIGSLMYYILGASKSSRVVETNVKESKALHLRVLTFPVDMK